MDDDNNIAEQNDLEDEILALAMELKKKKQIYINNGKFIVVQLAGDIVFDCFDSVTFSGNNRGYAVMNDETSEIYRYKDGVYTCDGERIIRATAQLVLGDNSSNTRVNEVVHAVKNFIALRVDRTKFNGYIDLVNLKNCVFNTETHEILPHDMKYYFTTKLPFDYNKDAKAPECMKFFKDILYPEDVPIMQELFGYCLFPTYRYHKIFFLIGVGRNGKGTTENLLKAFLGEGNSSAVSIDNLLSQQNMTAELFGKSANICGEIGSKTIEDSELLKMLSGEDLITGHRKYAHPFQFVNYAKLIFAMNEPPEIKDRTNGMWDRLIFLIFPNTFLDKHPGTDPNIKQKLITPEELSGLFNWAVDGLKRLKEKGGFSYSKSVEQNMREYDRQANAVLAYAQDFLDEDESAWIVKEQLWSKIKAYCIEHKVKVVSSNQLTRKLTDAIPSCYPSRIRINNEQRYVYVGIRFRDDNLNEKPVDAVEKPEESQQKLNIDLTLQDKVNNLLTCIEMYGNDISQEKLEDEGFEPSFIAKCLERNIIRKKPNGNYAIGG